MQSNVRHVAAGNRWRDLDEPYSSLRGLRSLVVALILVENLRDY